MSRKILLLFQVMIFVCEGITAQDNFVVKDILACDPAANIIDPEYNTSHNLVCWQSEERELWVCRLDLFDHTFVPPDGRGYMVDYNLTPPSPGGWNGPEWMLSVGSTQIIYNQKKGSTRYPGLATQVLGGWTSTTLMQYPDALYSMATRDYNDSVSMFLFESSNGIGIHWVKNNNLNVSYFYPNVTLGFFANDGQQICCALNHSRQPGFLETQQTVPHFNMISQDTIGAPFMWIDPETNTRMFMYRTNGSQTVKIFQENSDGNWYLYHSFDSPIQAPYIYITSPEPFTFKGKSYVSFMAAQSTMGMDELPAQIWITSINPYDQLMRRVSDTSYGVRIDPEPVIIGDSAFIYYTERIHTHFWHYIRRVRKCDTGLESFTTSINQHAISFPVKIFPNPSDGNFNLESKLFDQHSDVTAEILDQSGRKVRSFRLNTNPYLFHLPDLAAGIYILSIKAGNQEENRQLMIRK
jgi:hypothetical protein